MRFNELYNQKILKFISENRCDLSNLSLQKINSNIYSFTSLIELNLSENQICNISSQIENLLNLKTLNLSDNSDISFSLFLNVRALIAFIPQLLAP